MLPTPPHCATSRPPGRRTAARFAEQRVVVGDPVERRGRQDRVDRPVDRQRRAEVGDDVLDPVAEAGEPLARGLDHRRRPVERDDPAARQALGEQLGDAAAAAAGVEDPLVAVERQAIEHDRRPSASSGRRRGRRSGRPSRGHRRSAGRRRRLGRAGGLGGRRAAEAPGAARAARPRHERADDEQARRTRASPGGTRRSRPGSRPTTWAAVAPAPGGLSGWNARRMAGSVVSRPVSRAERRVEGGADRDEDERAEERLADPRDRVVDGRPDAREAPRDRAHQRARQRRDDARDPEPEQERRTGGRR